MPKYKYKAVNLNCKHISGIRSAQSEEILKDILRNEQLWLLSCSEYHKDGYFRALPYNILSEFCRQLSSMISSGMPLLKVLETASVSTDSKSLKRAYVGIAAEIRKGNSLSAAMSAQKGLFPNMLINMVQTGENGGIVDKALMKMAVYYEKEYRISNDMRNAATYPVMLVVMTIAVMVIIFTFVMPKFSTLFADMQLPALTRAVMAIGQFFKEYGFLSLILLVMAVSIFAFMQSIEKIRIHTHRFLLKLPRLGKLLKITQTAHFARTLSALYGSGMPIVSAMNTSKLTVSNAYIKSRFEEALKLLKSGETLAASIAVIDGFELKLPYAVQVGEQSGNLAAMLESLASNYEYESEKAVKKFMSLLEPVIICIMGVGVALCIMSVLQPIYNIYSSIG